MNNWKLVAMTLAATGALVLSAACSSSSSGTDTTGAGGGSNLGPDCTAYKACCATYPASAQQACNDAAAMLETDETNNPGNVTTDESACKSAVDTATKSGFCGAGGAGGSGSGGSGGASGDAADDLGAALGLDAACVTCIKTMCAAEVTACDADMSATNCASAISTLAMDHTAMPSENTNCIIEAGVGTVAKASELITCVSDHTKCGTAAGATTPGTCSLVEGFVPADHKTDSFMCPNLGPASRAARRETRKASRARPAAPFFLLGISAAPARQRRGLVRA